MFFNNENNKQIIKEVFGELCYGYPASGYNMYIANMNGIFNYTEEYIKTGKVVNHNGKLLLTGFDDSLLDEKVIKITSENELRTYLIKVNNWMAEQFQRCLPEASNKMVDSILKVLD